MSNNKPNNWNLIIFLGAIWGISEASLGYLFHLLSVLIPGIAGFFMFPVAFFFLNTAYRKTGQFSTLIYIAVIAASLKLVNLFLPVLHPVSTINPAVSIILEAVGVALFIKITDYNKDKVKSLSLFSVSVTWRLLFLIYLALVTPAHGLLTENYGYIIRFMFLDSLINTMIIAYFIKLPVLKIQDLFSAIKTSPRVSLVSFALALIFQIVL